MWLGSSASAGASLWVERKNWVTRMVMGAVKIAMLAKYAKQYPIL
jgi:hypothetical protein